MLKKKKRAKTFLVGYVRMCLEPNLPRSYILQQSIKIKLFNTHQVQLIGRFVSSGLLVTVAMLKTSQKMSLKSITTLFMRLLRIYFLRRLLRQTPLRLHQV